MGIFSGTQQDIVNRKTALQTTDTPAQANLIRFSLVHKRRKIGPEFWPTQRAAIRLGIASCHAPSLPMSAMTFFDIIL